MLEAGLGAGSGGLTALEVGAVGWEFAVGRALVGGALLFGATCASAMDDAALNALAAARTRNVDR
jgi:hypothetical protein